MRIGLITFSRAKNYGAVLQTYALYNFLSEMGNDVYVIDYIPKRCAVDSPSFLEDRTQISRFWGKNAFLKKTWKIIYLDEEKKEHYLFYSFLKQNVRFTESYYSNEEIRKKCPKFDIYVTGSDQVWNTDFTWDHQVDFPYFLDFAPENSKKISYASSFGRTELEENTKEDIYSRLNKYFRISVRESSAKQIVESFGLNATTVVDPTLLYNAKDWSYVTRGISETTNKYLLVFMIRPNRKLVNEAKKVAKDMGIDTKIVVSSQKNKRKLAWKAEIPDVIQWIAEFRDAEFIITDSFHGTAFSIIFQKKFLSVGNGMYNTRIHNILGQLKLEEREISDLNLNYLLEMSYKEIDYTSVNTKLEKLRMDSIMWLQNALSEETSI